MKKICLILAILVSVVLSSNAQKSKVQSAFNYLKNGQLDRAKEAIDEACENASTANYTKAWYYKGKTYYAIAVSEDAEYKALDANAIDVAYSAFTKAKELDIQNEFTDQLAEGFSICAAVYFNQGVALYQSNTKVDSTISYKTAELFEKAYTLFDLSDPTSLNSLNSVYFSASSYADAKNTTKAQEMLDKANKYFADSLKIVLTQINVYLQTNQSEKANVLLKKAIDKDPKNPSLHFAIGTTFEKQNNLDEAEKAYLKAIEFNPKFFDAYYNLGVFRFKNGASLKITADEKFDPMNPTANSELVQKYEAEWKKAQEFLEKALELQANDQYTLRMLSTIYNSTSQTDKYNSIKDRIKK